MDAYESAAEAIAAAARTLQHPEQLDEVLLEIATTARRSLSTFDLIGISTLEGKNVVTRAVTDQKVYALDRLQYSEDEGPCVDVLGQAHIAVAEHLRHEQRWPRYVPQALKLGLRSQMAIKVSIDDEGTLGGLNMYSTISDEIPPDAASIGELFARHAAVALGGAHAVEHLNRALETRKVIGQALGILMERYQMTEDRAFGFLVRASSTSNLKLHAVAQELVDGANTRTARAHSQLPSTTGDGRLG